MFVATSDCMLVPGYLTFPPSRRRRKQSDTRGAVWLMTFRYVERVYVSTPSTRAADYGLDERKSQLLNGTAKFLMYRSTPGRRQM